MRLLTQLIIVFVIFSFSFMTFAQQAEFETSFYFEDANGNRDTIIVGADTTANGIENPHLGMNSLSTPWDSTFEVRVCDGLQYWYYFDGLVDSIFLYKKWIIDPLFVPPCGIIGHCVFLIHSHYYPVKITWDTLYWTQCEYGNGSFLYNRDEILEPGWWTIPGYIPYSCMESIDSFILDTTFYDNLSGIIDTVQGVGVQFIYGIRLHAINEDNPLSPCMYVEVHEPRKYDSENFNIYPSPVSESIHISFTGIPVGFSEVLLRVFDLQGSLVYQQPLLFEMGTELNVNDFSPGLYFISIQDLSGTFHYTQKFVISH